MTLRILAVLFALRALTDVVKPMLAGSGVVFLGKLWTGVANDVLAPVLGIALLVYAFSIWTMRRFALPLGIAYAGLVAVNVFLFPVFQGLPRGFSVVGYVAFGVIGIGASVAAVWLLGRHRVELT